MCWSLTLRKYHKLTGVTQNACIYETSKHNSMVYKTHSFGCAGFPLRNSAHISGVFPGTVEKKRLRRKYCTTERTPDNRLRSWKNYKYKVGIHLQACAYYTCFAQMSRRGVTVPALVLMAGVAMVMAAVPFPGIGELHRRNPDNVNLTEVWELDSLRSLFSKVNCGGEFDQPIIRRLEKICHDCYNLFQRDEITGLCRLVSTAAFPRPMTLPYWAGPIATFAFRPQVSNGRPSNAGLRGMHFYTGQIMSSGNSFGYHLTCSTKHIQRLTISLRLAPVELYVSSAPLELATRAVPLFYSIDCSDRSIG